MDRTGVTARAALAAYQHMSSALARVCAVAKCARRFKLTGLQDMEREIRQTKIDRKAASQDDWGEFQRIGESAII